MVVENSAISGPLAPAEAPLKSGPFHRTEGHHMTDDTQLDRGLSAVGYSVAGAVLASGLPRTKIFALIRDGHLDARKCGRRTVIIAGSLRSYLDHLPPARRAVAVDRAA